MPRHAGWFRYCALAVASLAAACAPLPARSAFSSPAPARELTDGGRGAPTLERRDFAALDVMNAADGIGRLRPDFLRGSGRWPSLGVPEIAVYVNGVYDGDPSTLRLIPIEVINSVSFLQPVSAYARFGPHCRCANGAIVVDVLGTR